MGEWVKLTNANTGEPLYVNLANVTSLERQQDFTLLTSPGSREQMFLLAVRETPEQILNEPAGRPPNASMARKTRS